MEYTDIHGSCENTDLFLDLIMLRDFYMLWCKKYGNKVFFPYGIQDRTYYDWKVDLYVI